jgi:hypothetical protein
MSDDKLLYVVFLEDRDGGADGYEEFESASELLKAWPYATKDSEHEYSAWSER